MVPSFRRRRSMNRTSLLGSLVLGLAACTTGFSFELLDRMLGYSGCGCDTSCCASSCCKSRCHNRCGCNNGCNKGCGGCGGCNKCGHGCSLLGLFSCHHGCGCGNGCNKGCGCAAAAPSCAAPSCAAAAPACGCDGMGKGASAGSGDVVPMPPAPVVDPSAYIPTQRRVVHASTSLVR